MERFNTLAGRNFPATAVAPRRRRRDGGGGAEAVGGGGDERGLIWWLWVAEGLVC
ncbi:UNVERIFIED_CONTAM: hypothetical protein Sradi_3678200 [Sesamum radiatum]|uniref:Uncharacterized protein n=1 Tax=Sesamum radiatum TaxID=300843 RepID=A0AAW2QIX9_SESRA